MALIVGKADIRASFERKWTSSFVPALLLYGERSKKKSLTAIHSQLVDTGILICMPIPRNNVYIMLKQMMRLVKKLHFTC